MSDTPKRITRRRQLPPPIDQIRVIVNRPATPGRWAELAAFGESMLRLVPPAEGVTRAS